jgi:hypothetical protein
MMLDNVEQVVAAAPLIAALLTSVAALRVLVTSRAPLHVRGEREYAVGPLALIATSHSMSPYDLEPSALNNRPLLAARFSPKPRR